MSAAINMPRTQDVTFPHLPARPWKYTGHSRSVYQAIPGDPSCPVQPGASCDHCGTAISDCFHFEAKATGETFKVGCDCVRKMLGVVTHSNSLSAAELAARKIRNAAASVRREKKTDALRAELMATAQANAERLACLPHPNKWRADKGDTAADWAAWMAQACGLPGLKRFKAELARLLEEST